MQITREQEEWGVKILLVLVGIAIVIDLGSLYYLGSNGLVGKMWKVVWHNFQFPTVLTILAGIGILWKFRNPEEFTFGELGIYLGVLIPAAFPIAAMLYFGSTNLHDVEIWNGRAVQAVYEEKWTELVYYTEEECSGSGDNRSCTSVLKTREDYHPPKWYVTTSNKETVSVSSAAYGNYAKRFGNQTFKRLLRLNQVSSGDGNMYYSDWKGQPETIVPTSVEHPFVNYLRASKSITKVQGVMSSYSSLLLPYPHVHSGPLGNIYVDRVLSAGVKIPDAWRQGVSDGLSAALATLGAKKQVNVLVYVANTDIGFFYALKEYWTDGKKNDVIVVIGSKDGLTIDWVQVQAWTKVELFKIQLADALRALKTLDGNAVKLVDVIVAHVDRAPEAGGFQRMPMADLEYLLVEIKLPLWATILMIVLNLLVLSPLVFFLTTNNMRSRRAYAQ